ncbi:hypothetical protein T05_7281 [Trichinella murrelli]|uniref:Uncharacterized protein n=1 Tax=Trichinella murrelli TaxID=144512 RepID=A0A0V0T7V1_9BILA|nr:hypothetical protein T05_7281 [Trichinella murrelli]
MQRVRRVTLHDATLTISNDQSPYFHSSPFPLPVAVPGACRLARIPAMGAQARDDPVHLCGNGRCLKSCAMGFQHLCEFCQSSGDRYSPRGTVSVAMLLCYCLAGSDRLHPMIDIRSAVTPFN